MKNLKEIAFYVSICIGLSISTTAFAVISGVSKNVTGLWTVITLILSGIFCLVISNSIAVLASIYPSSPGIRTYLKKAFGDDVSLFFVFAYLIFIIMIGSVDSYMFATILNFFVPEISPLLIIFLILSFVVIINCFGLELPREIQIVSAYVLYTAILILGIYGIASSEDLIGRLQLSLADSKQAENIPTAMGMAIFLFVGFEWVTPLGFNSSSYKWKIPLSMPIAISLNIILYCVFVTGLYLSVPITDIINGTTPQLFFAEKIFGRVGAYAALFLSALGMISTFNAGVMGGARFIFALGREKNLPKWTTKISLSTGIPVGAILTLGVLVFVFSVVVVQYRLELIFAVVGSSIVCFVYALLMLALIRISSNSSELVANYKSRVPKPIQWLFIFFLPVLGILSLLSIPGKQHLTILCFTVILVCAYAYTKVVNRVKGIGGYSSKKLS